MKKQILNLGRTLTKADQKQVKGGVVPNKCFNNKSTGYVAECREIALADYLGGGCPSWHFCYSSGPTGCIDMCMHDPAGL